MKRLYAVTAACAFLLAAGGMIAVRQAATQTPPDLEPPRVTASIDTARAPAFQHALADPTNLRIEKLPVLPPDRIDTETIWLARAMYAETKRPREQVLVAWVVRNRVETGYRGNASYREAVLDPYQFSAFNPESPKRQLLLALGPRSEATGWQRTLRIAYAVRHAPERLRPFSTTTRHFFSERSMIGDPYPYWAVQRKLVAVNDTYEIDQRRFRFYEDIS